MKKSLLFALSFAITIALIAQEEEPKKDEGYVFTIEKEVPATSVKDQYRSGTCWSFSTLSFIEAELLRMDKGNYDLSEMYVAYKVYSDKAEKYVRTHGALKFSGGGALNDAIDVIAKYGIIPEEVYNGLNIGEKNHIHGEMDAVLKGMIDKVILNKNKKLTPRWHEAFEGMLDAYLGEVPETFTNFGKEE